MIRAVTLMLTLVANSGSDDPFRVSTAYNVQDDKSPPSLVAQLTINPEEGWKYNRAYPATAALEINGRAVASDHTVAYGVPPSVAFTASANLGDVPDPPYDIVIIASFSLCTETSCRVWRRKRIAVAGSRAPIRIFRD